MKLTFDSERKTKSLIHIFGHIHESYGFVEMDGTRFVNAANADHLYRMTHPPIVLEI